MPSAGAEEIGLCLADKIAVQDTVNTVLALGPTANQRRSVGNELTQSLCVLVRQPDLGQITDAGEFR